MEIEPAPDAAVEARDLDADESLNRVRMIEDITERVTASRKNDLKGEELEALKAVKIYLSRINDGCNKYVAATDTAILDKKPSYSRKTIAWAKQ
ncbi:unnamed protein product [Mortierella alpina]